MEQSSLINLAEFLSVCVSLSELCGDVIREVHESGYLGVKEKESQETPEDKLTIADLQVQKSIELCISSCFPSIQIIGEEASEQMNEV